MSTTPKPFILIDGSSYLYRAFHALPPLTNSKGEPTGAVYGVLNMIRKLLTEYDPEYVAVVFDAKGKNFRHDLYPQYKANRPTMPEELRAQVTPLHDAIQAMGIPLIMVEGVEADDVIGTLAKQAVAKKWPVLISTGDKDIAQLVDEHVTLINTMSNTLLDRKGVLEKFGIPPERIIDYLVLVGDTSDNIPGVDKVGPKTAVKWLNEYGSLENIIAHADKIPGKIGENLRTALPMLPIAQQLVTLQLNAAVPFSPEQLHRTTPDTEKLLTLYKHLEFKNWLRELLEQKNTSTPTSVDYQTILTETDFFHWLKRLQTASVFAFDTETTSLNSLNAELVGISFAVEPNSAAYVPLAHDYPEAPQQLSRAWVLAQLKPLLENPATVIVGQNIKYDMEVLANYAITINATLFDTMLESYILNTSANRHDLNTLALKYLGKQCSSFEDVAGKGSKQLTFNQIPLETATPYAAEDADITLQLHQCLWPQIADNDDLKVVLTDIELPLIPVLCHMERTGVMINCAALEVQSKELAKRLEVLETEAYKLADSIFNLASPKQLQEIFFEKLKLPVIEKTPTGVPSTAESVLQELALDYPLPKVILEHRSLSKLKSTYTDSLPKQVSPQTGRIHTSYNQAVTSTGRLSSTEPNLQNIPIKNEEGRRIRQAFIAPPGYKIISADYSQIELRIMAHLSQDPGLLRAFAQNIDVHTATAAEVFGSTLENVTAEQRRHAKAINFGLMYGMSAFGLAKQLNIDRQIAQIYIDKYFARYPSVKAYMEGICEIARKQGYVETLFGRRLYLPEIQSSQMQRRKAAERAAINAPMQGTAADMIKIAMISIDRHLYNSTLDAKMIMQVHDELVFEVAENQVETAITEIKKHMTTSCELSVPLLVHIGVGNNWDEAH